jgi:Spy/CpxP family protein refolding chaperone
MKKFIFFSLLFFGFLLTFSVSFVRAQDELPGGAPNKMAERPRRPNLFAELGLSPEQRQQIRQINQERKTVVRDAQQRLRDANRNLDQAIYGDNVNESEIQARLKAVQTAQAELIKLRFTNELAIRKILTAEQIVRFRTLREQFAQIIENNSDGADMRPMRNLKQRFRLRPNQTRQNKN